MKELIRIICIFALCFITLFIIAKTTGILSLEQIETWLAQAKDASPITVAAIIIALLFMDLFITVPTLSLIMLSGYFLGYAYGALASITGLMITGCSGYALSYVFGGKLLHFLIKDQEKRDEMKKSFHRHGFILILLSRAVPMMPEICACLSGCTRLPFPRFLLAWSISTLPYVLIAAHSGSISSLDDPMPALFTAFGMTAFLWIGGYVFHRSKRKYVTDDSA